MNKQTAPYTIEQYVEAGCGQLVRDGLPDLIGAGIHGATRGMMCNGCPQMKAGCKAFLALSRKPPILRGSVTIGETVRQEAARLGVGINEIRRRRAALGAV